MTNPLISHPGYIAYVSLPLWQDYLRARSVWEDSHRNYVAAYPSESLLRERRAELVAAGSTKDLLLAQLRATPEHLQAFGW